MKTRVQTLAPHSYTCGYKRLSSRTFLEIATHREYLRKRAVATLSYSPASTLRPQVIYAIAFPAGQNGVQVDQINMTTNELLLTAACAD